MSFEEHDDCFLWSCDNCGHEIAFKPHDFYGCVAELKARGWLITHDDERWVHRCARCRKSLAELLKMPLKQVGQ
jgi:hypothetical protein